MNVKNIIKFAMKYKMPTTFSEWAFQVTFAFFLSWIFIGLGVLWMLIF